MGVPSFDPAIVTRGAGENKPSDSRLSKPPSST
jgi:hypothetical protein